MYVRNFVSHAIVKRVSLMHFPTCFALTDFNDTDIHNDEDCGGEQVLAVIGTKDCKVLAYKISSSGSSKMGETRAGLSYGAISAIDINTEVDKFVVASEAGELFTADLTRNLSSQQQDHQE